LRDRAHLTARRLRLARLALLVLLDLALVCLALNMLHVSAEVADERLVLGQWESLDTKRWVSATSGWRAPGQFDFPVADTGYDGRPLALTGRSFDDGLSLFPYGEVVYRLDEAYGLFEATVGAQPHEWVPGGAVRFAVYGDNAPLFDSGPLVPGAVPREVSVGLAGVRELRLVAAAVDDLPPTPLVLGEPRLLRPLVAAAAERPPGRGAVLLAARQERQRQRLMTELESQAAARATAVRRWRVPQAGPEAIVGGRLPDGGFALASREVAAVLDTAEAERGRLSVLDLVHGRYVATGLAPAVTLAGEAPRSLSRLVPSDAGTFEVVETAADGLGAGQTLRIPLAAPEGDLQVTVELSLFADRRAVLLQLVADRPVQRFELLGGDADGGLVLGSPLRYVTDFSRPREARVRADGLERPELVGLGAPVFLWSERPESGVVLAMLDETEQPPRFGVRRQHGELLANVSFGSGPLAPGGQRVATRSPRLYLEGTETADPRVALAPFRALSAALYPAPPLPAWVRHQWGSWYVYGTNVDEWKIREQVDYLATYLGDLGPWHILLDAGWFIAEGRDGAELGSVDTAKFPSGIRATVDYAHQHGIRVILYYSAPYVDTRATVSSWLALPGFIARHRDWLLPLGAAAEQQSYVYNFAHPGLRQYMRDLLRRYYVEWNADGLLVDMLGHTEGAVLNLAPPDRFGVVAPALGQTMAIHRFLWQETQRLRPDAFVESAWDTPLLARPYAHTWRYADDTPTFRAAYPFPGFVDHVDYAILQRLLLGQRPHMGAVIRRPDNPVNLAWLGAGLALGTQVVVSLPLTAIGPADLHEYRAYLSQMRPFEGQTYLGAGLHPDTFATTRDGTTFLGVLNREPTERDVPVDLEELGLAAGTSYLAYDVQGHRAFVARDGFVAHLPAEAFRLYVLRGEPGLLWTSSGFESAPSGACLAVTLDGPERVPGYLEALTPPPHAVLLDGQPLDTELADGEGYRYDAATGLLSVRYQHAPARTLQVEC
jgi:hypothetical protein